MPPIARRSEIIGTMSVADLLPGRLGLARRLPGDASDLRGPVKGVIMLPRHLAWPGMREFDVSDDRIRRSMYGIVLTQGKRNDIARFVNAGLLSQDWPVIRESLEPRLRRRCERQFGLGGHGGDDVADDAAATAARGAQEPAS
jgi:hypothetical protein